MTYLIGSRQEGYGETGMAHLLEHMVFKQTKGGRDVIKELTDHGANFNGTTSYDRTNYFETVTATDENLRWAIGLEADRMVNMRMEKALLDTEMTVVRNEFEAGENNPAIILAAAGSGGGLHCPQLRQDHHRQPVRYRERAHRAAGGVLPQVLSARRRHSRDHREVRRIQSAGLGSGILRRHSASPARAREELHGGADPGWRAVRYAAPRGRQPGHHGGLSHSGRVAPRQRGFAGAGHGPGRHALRPALQGPGGHQEGGRRRV